MFWKQSLKHTECISIHDNDNANNALRSNKTWVNSLNFQAFVTCGEMRKVLTTLGDVLNEDEIKEIQKDADPLKRGNINYWLTQILNDDETQ